MKKDSLFRGTALLSISLLLTKILGLVYIIPFYQIIGGEKQMALFNFGYSYYAVILEIASAGTPLAIAKLVAKYNALEQYATSRKIVKLGSLLLISFGIIGFLVLFLGADIISQTIIISKDQNFLPSELALVLRSLSVAVPIVLVATGFKGLFQGHEIMLPTAVSQFIEQVVRIAFLLGGAALVVVVLKKGIVIGNVVATFSAAVGAIFSLTVLLYYYKKYYKQLEYRKEQKDVKEVSTFNLVKEFFSVSIPFIFISGLFPLLNIIDQHNFVKVMEKINMIDVADEQFSALQLINKVVMIAVAISPAFSSTFLPAITRLYALDDKKGVSEQINKVILALMMIVIPALVGMYILADPLYSVFFARNIEYANLLQTYLPLAILFSIYSMTSIIMQAINRQTLNLLTIVVGVVIKYFSISPLVSQFQARGVIYSSILTYVVMITINLIIINMEVKLKFGEFLRYLTILLSGCFIMFITVAAIYSAIINNFNLNAKVSSIILMTICGFFGVVIYFYAVNKMNLIKYLFGKKLSLISLVRRRR